MPIDPNADITVFAYSWVPNTAKGYVRDLRPRWALEEAGLSYRTELIHAGEKRPDTFLREQTLGQVPALTDNAIRIFESGAILLHLAEKSEVLMPKDPQGRASTQSWLLAAFNSVEPFVFELFFVNVIHRKADWAELRRPSAEDMLRRRLTPVDAALSGRDYLAGPFTVADIAMATVLREAKDHLGLADFPALDAYLKRCLARPAFQRALDAQMADFTAPPPTAPAS